MPSELKKPEPFGYVSDFKQAGIMSFQHAPWDQTHSLCHSTSAVYTAAQLERYAADRVREAELALTIIAQMDRTRTRADDLGRAARIAFNTLRTLKEQTK